MTSCRTVLILAAALCLTVAAHDHGGCKDKKRGLPQIFKDIDQCCEPPMPLGESYLDGCKMRRKSQGDGHRHGPPTPYQRMCLFDCAFKNFNYSNGGTIDTDALTSAFVNSVNSTWQARARESVDYCLAELKTKFQSSSVPAPPSGETQCDGTPAFLLICIHVRYYATCSPDINTSSCASNVDKLVKMDYLDLFLNGDKAVTA